MTDKKPTTAIYDFHHNVRDVSWNQIQTEGATAGTTGFHPVVFVEAGGHRSLYAEGEDITVQQGYNIMQSIDKTHPEYAFQSDNTPWGDELFGLMVDGLENYPVRAFIGYNFISVEAEWRKFSVTLESVDVTAGTAWWWVGAIIEDSVSLTFRNVDGEYSDNGGAYLCVEDFKKVYVYSVGAEVDNEYPIGYTGDNYPSIVAEDSTLGAKYNYWPRVSGGETHLPWTSATTNSVYQSWKWTSGATRGWAWNEELSSP